MLNGSMNRGINNVWNSDIFKKVEEGTEWSIGSSIDISGGGAEYRLVEGRQFKPSLARPILDTDASGTNERN